MLALIAAFALGWLAWQPAPPPVAIDGVISAYSCDPVPANPMAPCGLFRNGQTPSPALHGKVAACPYEWLGESVTIEGYGVVRCVDTPRDGWYGARVHIDLFMAYPDAIEWGIRERMVQRE